uniref:Protein kinase domain-containing protein n=1 Tax=Manihot esculenta TaxID=3983 RepID=A0A2C9U2U7_MANES
MIVLQWNKLTGKIPRELANNNLTGKIPLSLGNLSSLTIFSFHENNLEGSIPNQMSQIKSQKIFTAEGNRLSDSLSNASQLQIFDISSNKFVGQVPTDLQNLKSLSWLNFETNNLGSNSSNDLVFLTSLTNCSHLEMLSFSMDHFGGVIPNSITNLSTRLNYLYLGENEMTGTVPVGLENLINLIGLAMEDNSFTDLSNNKLEGLDLSQYSFTGNLPAAVGKLKNVNALDISQNNHSGEIPRTIGDCLNLEYLYMQRNFFQGTIPSSLASLRGLRYLDLSQNNLSGQIPKDLQEIPYLQYLNLSFNNLKGKVPKRGVFANVSALSLIGNNKLCGGVPELRLPKCPTRITKKVNSHTLMLAIAIACGVPSVVLILMLFLICWMKKLRSNSSFASLAMNHLLNVSYKDLYQATNGFSSCNLIGSGFFSSVYKGFLPQVERQVAIKVLNLEQTGAIKVLNGECKTLKPC